MILFENFSGILGVTQVKLSTKGRYGMRAMIDIAAHSHLGIVTMKHVAEREGISENYLEQVFLALKKGGLVKSIKGSQGGYILAEEPEDITAGMILRVLEGEMSIIDEEAEASHQRPQELRDFIRKEVWDKIDTHINNVIEEITLSELVKAYLRKRGCDVIMYYI